jgi:hypothetical protein
VTKHLHIRLVGLLAAVILGLGGALGLPSTTSADGGLLEKLHLLDKSGDQGDKSPLVSVLNGSPILSGNCVTLVGDNKCENETGNKSGNDDEGLVSVLYGAPRLSGNGVAVVGVKRWG